MSSKFADLTGAKEIDAKFPTDPDEVEVYITALEDHFLLFPTLTPFEQFQSLKGTDTLPTTEWQSFMKVMKNRMDEHNRVAVLLGNPKLHFQDVLSIEQLAYWLRETMKFQIRDREYQKRCIGAYYPLKADPVQFAKWLLQQFADFNELVTKHNSNLADDVPKMRYLDETEKCEIIRIIYLQSNDSQELNNKSVLNSNIVREMKKSSFRTVADFVSWVPFLKAKALPVYLESKHKFARFTATTSQNSLHITRKSAFGKQSGQHQAVKSDDSAKSDNGSRKRKRSRKQKSGGQFRRNDGQFRPRPQKRQRRNEDTSGKRCKFGQKCRTIKNCNFWHPSHGKLACHSTNNCKYFLRNGRCKYAHSPQELESMKKRSNNSDEGGSGAGGFRKYLDDANPGNERSEKELQTDSKMLSMMKEMKTSTDQVKDMVMTLQTKSNSHEKQIDKIQRQRAKWIKKHGLDGTSCP